MMKYKFITTEDYKPNTPVTHQTVDGYTFELPEKLKGKYFKDSNGNIVPNQYDKGITPVYNSAGNIVGYMKLTFE